MVGKAKPNGDYVRIMSREELWTEVVRSIAHRFDGYDLSTADEAFREEVMDHAVKFHVIHQYKVRRTLDAVQVFVASCILGRKKGFGERLYNLSIDVMREREQVE